MALPGNSACVLELLDRACSEFSQKTALEWQSQKITYAQLNTRANRLAHALIENDLGEGSIIGVMLEDRIDTIVAMLSIFRAGAVFVPLDNTFPPERLRRIAADLKPRCILATPRTTPLCLQAGIDRELITWFSDLSAQSAHLDCAARPAIHVDPESLRYVVYTSGSTGTPKGIAGRLKGITHFIRWEIENFQITSDCRVTQFASPTFDPFFRDVFVPLCVGGTLCIPPQIPALMDSAALLEWIDSQKVSLIHCVPSLFASLVRENPNASRFSALKHVLLAGETLPITVARRWMKTFGDRITLVNLYGATETTMVKFFHVVTEADLDRGFIPIGQPMPGAKALIIDEGMNVCPRGIAGEIIIRTPYRTLGYFNNPEATRAAFIPNPFSSDPADIVYRTGDLGRVLSNGDFQLLGRRDQQVKIRGIRIELSEIESALLECPLVSEATVVACDEDGEKRLAGYIVPADKSRLPQAQELRDYLRTRLPEYMVPAMWVLLGEIPHTPNGKVDHHALPIPERNSPERIFIEPATPAEREMSRIWAEVLGLEKAGTADNFFDLGGHSLLATQVVSRVRNYFNVDLPVRALFEYPTVAELALELTRLQAQSAHAQDLSDMLNELTALSDDEIAARLAGNTEK